MGTEVEPQNRGKRKPCGAKKTNYLFQEWSGMVLETSAWAGRKS